MDSPDRPHCPPDPQTPRGTGPGLQCSKSLGAHWELDPTYLAWRSLQREVEGIHARLEYVRLMLKLDSRDR